MTAMHFTRRSFNGTLSLCALSSALPLLVGCRKKTQGFHVGLLTPKTGLQALAGLSCERGARVAEILLQELKLPISLSVGDTESKVDTGRLRAEKLIHDGVHCLVGAFDSAVSAVVAGVCEHHKTPFIINLSAAEKITQQGYQYTFRNFQTAGMLLDNNFKLMQQLFKKTNITPKSAAVIAINDTYGQAMSNGIKAKSDSLPFPILEHIIFDSKTTDLSIEVKRLKNSGAELIIPITRGPDSIIFIKECIRQKLNPKVGFINPGSPGMYDKQFYDVLGKASDYIMTNAAWYNPHSELTKRAQGIFKTLYPNELFEMNAVYTIEALYIAAKAYYASTKNDATTLRKNIANTNLAERFVCGGPIQFDEHGQAKNLKSATIMNLDGRPQIIQPNDLAETKPVFPFPRFNVPDKTPKIS